MGFRVSPYLKEERFGIPKPSAKANIEEWFGNPGDLNLLNPSPKPETPKP